MKAPRGFTSTLAERMAQFIAFKRMQGHDYRDGADRLRRFDAFLAGQGCGGSVLRAEDVEGYRARIAGLSHSSRVGNLSTVRQFALYLHALEPESALPAPNLVPRAPRPVRFHPLSAAQVGQLMAAADAIQPGGGAGGRCMRFLVGLLYSTGLRISEALALDLADVDLAGSTLFVRQGKFRKARMVAISPSTREAAEQWLARRREHARCGPGDPLLATGRGGRLTRDRAERLLRRLCVHCGMTARPPPRLHDLRHNYACACLEMWRRRGEDVDALLPVLANAMGHVDFHSTELYVHLDARALRRASETFRRHVSNLSEHRT